MFAIALNFIIPVPQQTERAAKRQAVSAASGAGSAARGNAEHRPPRLRTAGAAATEESPQSTTSGGTPTAAAKVVIIIIIMILVDRYSLLRNERVRVTTRVQIQCASGTSHTQLNWLVVLKCNFAHEF